MNHIHRAVENAKESVTRMLHRRQRTESKKLKSDETQLNAQRLALTLSQSESHSQ